MCLVSKVLGKGKSLVNIGIKNSHSQAALWVSG